MVPIFNSKEVDWPNAKSNDDVILVCDALERSQMFFRHTWQLEKLITQKPLVIQKNTYLTLLYSRSRSLITQIKQTNNNLVTVYNRRATSISLLWEIMGSLLTDTVFTV